MNRTFTVRKHVFKAPPKFPLYATFPFGLDNLSEGDIAVGEEFGTP